MAQPRSVAAPHPVPTPQLTYGAAANGGASPDDIAELADGFATLMRSFKRAQAQLASTAERDVEWSAHILISILVREGALRSSALAELALSDPSTVSRQVAALVKDGLVERRADPDDGRASLLVATPEGQAVVREHVQTRNTHFERMLADWSERDCRRFAALLRRFADDFDRYRPQFCAGPAKPWPARAAEENTQTTGES